MLLIRNPISSTKKFFQKTLKSFKSLFSDDQIHYQKLPQTPPMSSSSTIIINNKNKKQISSSHQKKKVEMELGGREVFIEKLKELEKMDMMNVDHLLDIEEVLHYYSRLTSPAYLDIVDKFFMDMYAEFFASSSSRSNVRSLRLT